MRNGLHPPPPKQTTCPIQGGGACSGMWMTLRTPGHGHSPSPDWPSRPYVAIRADAPVAAPVSCGAGGVGAARKLRANVCPWPCACGLGAGMYAGTSARALPAPAAWAWRCTPHAAPGAPGAPGEAMHAHRNDSCLRMALRAFCAARHAI